MLYTGVGHHLSYVAARDSKMLILLAKFLIIQSYLYLVAVALPKLAMLSIYIRVFPNTIVRVICYILGSIVIIGCVVGLFFASFGCRPMAFFWDKNIPGGVCVDVHALYMWVSIPNLITDLIMLILPIPLVVRFRFLLSSSPTSYN